MLARKRVVALLPMKDHSQRIRGKIFRILEGRPLYQHVLTMLDSIEEVDQIAINTDSERVYREAPTLSKKLTLIRRPPELCGDNVNLDKITAYDLEHLEADVYLQTYVRNPLLQPETILTALNTYVADKQHDSLFSVTRIQSHLYDEAGSPLNHDPHAPATTHNLPTALEENRCLYVFSQSSFASTNSKIGKRPRLFETSRRESVAIDDETGWAMTKILMSHAKNNWPSNPDISADVPSWGEAVT